MPTADTAKEHERASLNFEVDPDISLEDLAELLAVIRELDELTSSSSTIESIAITPSDPRSRRGIPQDEIQRLFEALIDREASNASQRAGVGLSIVKRIIDIAQQNPSSIQNSPKAEASE